MRNLVQFALNLDPDEDRRKDHKHMIGHYTLQLKVLYTNMPLLVFHLAPNDKRQKVNKSCKSQEL